VGGFVNVDEFGEWYREVVDDVCLMMGEEVGN
jgi:hypothetical protein